MNDLAQLAELEPREAAARLTAEHRDEPEWLDAFAEYLDRQRAARSLSRILAVWDLNQSQAARLFGVSRQALSKWLDHGVPSDRTEALADVAAATDLLVHYLQRDRIPAVVRRAAPALGGRSLLELLAAGKSRAVLGACRDMFRFGEAQS